MCYYLLPVTREQVEANGKNIMAGQARNFNCYPLVRSIVIGDTQLLHPNTTCTAVKSSCRRGTRQLGIYPCLITLFIWS